VVSTRISHVEYPDVVYLCGLYQRMPVRGKLPRMFVVMSAKPVFPVPPVLVDAPTERLPVLVR
jgi:hypothetical protein